MPAEISAPAAYFDITKAPLRISAVRLKVRDLARMRGFYHSILGLQVIAEDAQQVTLGIGETPLLVLSGDPALSPNDPRQAGLFHTAFLLPARADLARWLAHAIQLGQRLQGASDHLVSEALYLADPEGNGIEIYTDRPLAEWHDATGNIRMATEPLDQQALLAEAGDTAWAGFPQGGCIGHVHLQVGDTGKADRFYRDIIGLEIAATYPGASFYGSGGYHHQLAGNIWNARGAGPRPPGMAGLDGLEITLNAAELTQITTRAQAAKMPHSAHPAGLTLHDPWGTEITLKA
ncbi:VOC family protein [Pararhodobacter oceanensis]|uniref:VOC family protein n=1 Tax=Pararhodobacter oceanensis TaxID=2172121 RepID=UPI003A8FFDBB